MAGQVGKYQSGTSPFDEIAKYTEDGEAHWSARDMRPFMGYDRWENFLNAIERAKDACRKAREDVDYHFREVTKMVSTGSGATRYLPDIEMTRFACNLVAMNGDTTKPQVAFAQKYFVVQTRRAEKELAPIETTAPPPPAPPALPWSRRVAMTFAPHKRFLNMNHPDGFTVASAVAMEILVLEDQLQRHLLPIGDGDRPDGSIGQCWAHYRRKVLMRPDVTVWAPLELLDVGRIVDLLVYPKSEQADFDRWFFDVYCPEKLPEYLAKKKEYRPFGRLPPYSAADSTALALTGKPAKIRELERTQLKALKGYAPAGITPPVVALPSKPKPNPKPKPVDPQRSFFEI